MFPEYICRAHKVYIDHNHTGSTLCQHGILPCCANTTYHVSFQLKLGEPAAPRPLGIPPELTDPTKILCLVLNQL